jgi:peptide/nickel transport system substrate-binding protein
MTHRSRRSILVGLVASALALAACGGDDDDDAGVTSDAPSASAEPSSDGTTDDTTAPTAGGTLRVVVTAEPRSLNQGIDNNSSALGISKLVNERLVWIDGQSGEPVPGLVESWEKVDELTWTLKLREGVTFTNGEPFDAEAAVFSIFEVRDGGGAYGPYVQTIADAEATDEHTVTLTTTQSIGFVPSLMAIIPAVPPEAYAATTPEDFGRAPIGTGPFVLDSWTPGQRLSFTRNEDYWGTPALLDGVEITWNSEPESRVALLETGEADLVKAVPPQLVQRVENGDGLGVLSVPSLGTIVLQPNSKVAPFDDVRVRQAAAHAIDREALVNTVFSGVGATVSDTIFPKTYASAVTPEGAPTFDPERAKELLAEVGDVGAVQLYWPNGRYLLDNQVGEAIAGMLENAGFQVERRPMEAGAYFELLLGDEMPGIHMISITSAFPHESYPLNSFFLPTSVVTYCAQEDLVGPYEESLGLEGDERAAAYAEIARTLVVDKVCPIPMYVENQTWGVSDDVTGFQPRGDEFLELAGVSLGD